MKNLEQILKGIKPSLRSGAREVYYLAIKKYNKTYNKNETNFRENRQRYAETMVSLYKVRYGG